MKTTPKKILLTIAILTIVSTPTNIKADPFDELFIGVKGGVNLANMHYEQEPYSIYNQETYIRPLFSAFLSGNINN